MIEVVAKDPDRVTLRVTVRRVAVYLDNWAIIALAKDRTGLREAFLRATEDGADVLFSVTNASEIVGPTGASQDAVREFFTAIGPHWIPNRKGFNCDSDLEVQVRQRHPGPDRRRDFWHQFSNHTDTS
jgi:hypothetical protein